MKTTKKQLDFRTENVNATLKEILGEDAPQLWVHSEYGYTVIDTDHGESLARGLTKTQAWDCINVAGVLLYKVEKAIKEGVI